MLTHDALVEMCKNASLDPFMKGPNFGKVLDVRADTTGVFDLKKIDFPPSCLEQVLMIGEIIQNLISNRNIIPKILDPTDESIKKILPILKKSQKFWLEKGLKEVKKKVDLVAHCGIVYELDPKYDEKIKEYEEGILDVQRDALRRLKMSEHLIAKNGF